MQDHLDLGDGYKLQVVAGPTISGLSLAHTEGEETRKVWSEYLRHAGYGESPEALEYDAHELVKSAAEAKVQDQHERKAASEACDALRSALGSVGASEGAESSG